MRSSPEGDSVTLVFGPACGEASLGGEPIDLTTAERGPGGRRGPGRSF